MSRSNTVEVVQQRLSRNLENAGATPAGVDWVISALDPFHDASLNNFRGFPDGTGMSSVVQVVQRSVVLSAPVGLTTTQTWDAHFVLTNLAEGIPFNQGNLIDQVSSSTQQFPIVPTILSGGSAQHNILTNNIGGLLYFTGNTGFSELVDPTNFSSGSLVPGPAFTAGTYRVIGQAFEVRSTGPDLFKSGSAYLWRLPSPATSRIKDAQWFLTGSGTAEVKNYNSLPTYFQQIWPTTVSDAQLIPTTVNLMAKEGCYVVGRFNNPDPALSNEGQCAYAFKAPGFQTAVTIQTVNGEPNFRVTPLILSNPIFNSGVTYSFNGAASTGSLDMFSGSHPTDFDQCGAMFAGLNSQDVLTVNVKWLIERFPDEASQELLVLAKPSPQFDCVAFDAYSHAASMLPVGVPVRENSLGDWFRSAASAIKEYAGPVIANIPHPIARAATLALSAVPSKAARRAEKLQSIENQSMEKSMAHKKKK